VAVRIIEVRIATCVFIIFPLIQFVSVSLRLIWLIFLPGGHSVRKRVTPEYWILHSQFAHHTTNALSLESNVKATFFNLNPWRTARGVKLRAPQATPKLHPAVRPDVWQNTPDRRRPRSGCRPIESTCFKGINQYPRLAVSMAKNA
jgi:hypothetical protein